MADESSREREKGAFVGKELLPRELWEEIEPLLPPDPPEGRRGRPRIPNRNCLIGIIFVLKTGAPWNLIPPEMGCGSGPTCWRRFRDWTQAGVWKEVWQRLLDRLGKMEAIDWASGVIDSASVRGVFGGRTPAQIRRTVRKMAVSGT